MIGPDIVEEITIKLRVTSPASIGAVTADEIEDLGSDEFREQIADWFRAARRVEIVR